MKILMAVLGFTFTSYAYAISCITIEGNNGAKYESMTSKTLDDCFKSHEDIVNGYSGSGEHTIKTTYQGGNAETVIKTIVR